MCVCTYVCTERILLHTSKIPMLNHLKIHTVDTMMVRLVLRLVKIEGSSEGV